MAYSKDSPVWFFKESKKKVENIQSWVAYEILKSR